MGRYTTRRMTPTHDCPPSSAAPIWPTAARADAFATWLTTLSEAHGVLPHTVRSASADASFRRYFRVDRCADFGGGSCIIMDAPPEQENCQPFVHVAALMAQAGLRVPDILDWHVRQGFMLLSDLGSHTLLEVLDAQQPEAHLGQFRQATAALLAWQVASRPNVLPQYDAALLRRELQLFPDWYVTRHKGVTLSPAQEAMLHQTFETLIQRILSWPQVFVHRDYMPRNLMLPHSNLHPERPEQALGVLDFQDAVYGPLPYDIASLMRDAFLSWDEGFVLDVTIRYWEQARQRGLLDREGWSEDFGAFYRAVEWMGLQRHLKVLGIFARLTLRDGKAKYLADTPRFIGYVRHTASRYRELIPLLRFVDELEGLQAASGYAFGRV